jgi:hypothetical protein
MLGAVSGAEADECARLEFKRRTKGPAICIECGRPTHRRVRVKRVGPPVPVPPLPPPDPGRASEGADEGCALTFLDLTMPGHRLFRKLLGSSKRGSRPRAEPRPVVRVRVPQCRECARRGKPEPVRADFSREVLVFEVHPRFADWVEQTRRGRGALRPPERGSER